MEHKKRAMMRFEAEWAQHLLWRAPRAPHRACRPGRPAADYPPPNSYRSNIVRVIKLNAAGDVQFNIDLDIARHEFCPDAQGRGIIAPMVAGISRLAVGGNEISLPHTSLTDYYGGTRHQVSKSTRPIFCAIAAPAILGEVRASSSLLGRNTLTEPELIAKGFREVLLTGIPWPSRLFDSAYSKCC